jgi:hypothetical protein
METAEMRAPALQAVAASAERKSAAASAAMDRGGHRLTRGSVAGWWLVIGDWWLVIGDW